MKPTLLLATAAVFLTSISVALAADPPATTSSSKPPSATTAEQVLKDSPRHGEWVDIALPGSDVKIHTWVSYPQRADKAPVVIVIHEIFGMTDWVRAVADQLAAEGFIAVAPDLVSGLGKNGGGSESFTGDEVRRAVSGLKPEETATRLGAVRDHAMALPAASAKTATIGFCWGGAASFAFAVHQPKLNAAAVYYGSPPKPDALGKIECPVAGFYGKNDARITQTVEPTAKAMAELNKPYEVHIYEGAGHGFLRQQAGQSGANQKAADEAWPATVQFLRKNLK